MQATAVSVARCLAAARGEAATSSQEANAQRSVQRMFERRRLSLPVPIASMDHEVVVGLSRSLVTYHVKPEDWIKYLLETDPSLLSGVSGDMKANNKAFWTLYKLQHETHAVFSKHGHRLEDVLPVFLHGDEGRGKKKTGYLVMSFESPFGSTARKHTECGCAEYLASRPDLPSYGTCNEALLDPATLQVLRSMFTNYRGHSFLTRHLLFGLGKSTYKSNPHVVEALLREIASSFKRLFNAGVASGDDQRLFVAVAGVKGDFDFHKTFFDLERCYGKVITRHGVGHICHTCNAATGRTHPGLDCPPFEDFDDEPEWRHSMFQARPWSALPILASLPFDVWWVQERMLIPDPFHLVKLGLARDLIGGIVIVLARKAFFDFEGSTRNLDDRLRRAESSFLMYCAACHERPAFRGFTRAFFHIKNHMSAPYTNSKGSDSMILLRWLLWLVSLNMTQPVVQGYNGLLRLMKHCCKAVLGMFRLLHSHKLFLERSCATHLYILMMRLLRGYKLLGQRAILLAVRAFVLKPKAHGLHHVAFSLKGQLESGAPLVLSPECHGCEPNEDYIGRVSRLSRKVGAQVVDLRVIQRVFLKTRSLHQKRGVLRK